MVGVTTTGGTVLKGYIIMKIEIHWSRGCKSETLIDITPQQINRIPSKSRIQEMWFTTLRNRSHHPLLMKMGICYGTF